MNKSLTNTPQKVSSSICKENFMNSVDSTPSFIKKRNLMDCNSEMTPIKEININVPQQDTPVTSISKQMITKAKISSKPGTDEILKEKLSLLKSKNPRVRTSQFSLTAKNTNFTKRICNADVHDLFKKSLPGNTARSKNQNFKELFQSEDGSDGKASSANTDLELVPLPQLKRADTLYECSTTKQDDLEVESIFNESSMKRRRLDSSGRCPSAPIEFSMTPPVKRFCTSPDDLLTQKSLKCSENFLKTISEGVLSDCTPFDENSEDLIVQNHDTMDGFSGKFNCNNYKSPALRLKRANTNPDAYTRLMNAHDVNAINCEDGEAREKLQLPVITTGVKSKRNRISDETMIELLEGKFDVTYEIIDCRYPFEFEGGHIEGAWNGWNCIDVVHRYLESNRPLWAQLSPDSRKKYKRPILIFHCEFSAQRAPAMYDNLRRADRLVNQYPHLHYPEMYILEKGYCNFYENNEKAKQYCQPRNYVSMFAQKYIDWRNERKEAEEQLKKKLANFSLKVKGVSKALKPPVESSDTSPCFDKGAFTPTIDDNAANRRRGRFKSRRNNIRSNAALFKDCTPQKVHNADSSVFDLSKFMDED